MQLYWLNIAAQMSKVHTVNKTTVYRTEVKRGKQCLYTHHQVAGSQEQHNTKDVDHAGGEHSIPGAEKHRLPHKQFDPPPRLAGLLEALIKDVRSHYHVHVETSETLL